MHPHQEALNLAKQIAGSRRQNSQSKWHALVASWLGEAFDAMDATLYFIALYPAMSELMKTKSDVVIGQAGSVVLAVFMFGWFLGAIGFGILADRIGRRRTMVITILVYSIATGLCAISHNWMELAACRFIVGFGIGGEICLGTVMIGEFWKGKSRLWAASALESSFNFGLLFAAGINAVVGPYGWRWLFVAGVAPSLLTLYIRSRLKESDSFEKVKAHRESLKGKAQHELTGSDRSFLRLPIVELWNSASRGPLLVTAALGMSAVIGYWSCIAWLPAWINQLTQALAINERSIATTAFSIGGLVGCFGTPLLCMRLGRKNSMIIAFGGALIATMTMFFTVKSFGMALVAWVFLVGVLTNMQFAALQIYIPEAFPTPVLATATGIIFGAGRIFAVALALCGAQLIELYNGSYALASGTLSLVYAIGFLAAFKLHPTSGRVVEVEIPAVDVGKPQPLLVAAD